MNNNTEVTLSPVAKLSKDLKTASLTLTISEIRYLVDAYYQIQENRKAAGNQYTALAKSGEPNLVIGWLADQNETLEKQIKNALDKWTDHHPVGKWAKSITGVGPVISAGLLAHIDITKAPTDGHIWRFAGLDPTSEWKKGEKRPWNASLKVLCWKIGQSFVKTSNLDSDFYGKLWRQRKEYEEKNSAEGKHAEQAKAKLEKYNIGKTTEAYGHYSAGHLPPAHLQARACRWTVKLFLSHWQQVAYRNHYGVNAPYPYVLDILGHVDKIQVPNWPFDESGEFQQKIAAYQERVNNQEGTK
jgi:hypothetical protein